MNVATNSSARPIVVGLLTIGVLVGGVGGWAALSTIAGAVVASGKLGVENHRQIVQHPDGGVVANLAVREGDHIEAGAPLLTLDGDYQRSELAMTEAQYYELLARRGRLEAERGGADAIIFPPELLERAAVDAKVRNLMEGQSTLFTARGHTLNGQREQLAERIVQVENQIRGQEAQIVALERQAELIGLELADQRILLEKGLTQSTKVHSLDREAARLEGQRGELASAVAEARGRIVETRIESLGLDIRRREEALTELRDIGVQELQLAERRASLAQKIDRLEIRAPVSGVVHGLQVTTPRAVLRAADPVAYVVPQDQPLIVSARLRNTDIDTVHMGQTARLRFPAFSSRTTPELIGHIIMLSADAFEDEQTGESYYLADVQIAPGELEKIEGGALMPGMPVEVMLLTSERSPLSYFVKPMSDYFVRAFREE